MQTRRHENYSRLSPPSQVRAQPRLKMGSDPYNGTRRDELDRSPRTRKSSSPHRIEGSRRVVSASRRSGSTEGMDYPWHLGGVTGGRSDMLPPRSPPFEQVQKRAQFNESGAFLRGDYMLPMELQQRYEVSDHADFKGGDDSLKSEHIYGYQHSGSRMGKEKDIRESRLSTGGGYGMLGQKSILMEDSIARGSYRLPQDLGPISNYGETGGHLSSSSRSIDIRQIEHERRPFRDTIAMDKLPIMESHKDGETPMFPLGDVPYPTGSASHSKDFASTSPLKDLASSSSRMLRSEFLGSYQGDNHDMHLPPDEFLRSNAKLIDPTSFSSYGRSPLVESAGDPEAGQRNLIYYQKVAYSPTRAKYEGYQYPKQRGTVNDDRGCPPDDLYRMIPPRAPLDYERAQTNYDHRDLSRPSIRRPVLNRVDDNPDDSHGNTREGTMLDYPTLEKQAVLDYHDMNRTSNASRQGGKYLVPGFNHAEFGRRLSQDYEISHLDASQDRQLIHLRSDYGFGKDAGPKFLKERLPSPPISKYESDMERHLRMQRVEEELALREPLDRLLKRNYSAEEELDGHDSRKFMSKWSAKGELQDLYDRREEWMEEDMSNSYLSHARAFDHSEYRKSKRIYDRLDDADYNEYKKSNHDDADYNEHKKSKRIYDRLERHGNFSPDEWLSAQDSLANKQRHSVRVCKHGSQYTKAYPRAGSLSSNMHHFNRRGGLKRQPNVWKRNDEDTKDMSEDYGDLSEDWVSPSEFEPAEESDEFKQLVHEAFLKYSKKLNGNPAVQRRYKEQGKGGGLFCIVCGRSVSKEFMDTQRLVTHAFMSHKVGLRAEHLGLHKAICVLLGWNTIVPQDTITWVPEALSAAEALAQKEDLILWPPVIVVHNISLSDNNPGKWKVVTIEQIEAFLRRKGFARGRIKVCLGKPADQSVMVVKFLGTFTGLGDAERLHKYFAESKRGRVDFSQATSNNGKSSNTWDAGMQEDNVEEHILYGYMGIAEDLDKVDYSTRKSNLIKSKKEIQDLANAPVRPDER